MISQGISGTTSVGVACTSSTGFESGLLLGATAGIGWVGATAGCGTVSGGETLVTEVSSGSLGGAEGESSGGE